MYSLKKVMLITTLLLFLLPCISAFSLITQPTTYNILIINSYNLKSNWEQLIYEGFKEKLSPYKNLNINIEFLDSKTKDTQRYKTTFLDLLNIKYSNEKIDAIVTVDDEAFNLVRTNIFNSNSIFYKKPIIFIGVNSAINLSTAESNYITGVIEMEDNVRILNTLIDINPKLENITILLDNAIFSNVVKEDIISTQNLTKKRLNTTFIQGDYIEDILNQLPIENDNKGAIILVGDFQSIDNNKVITLNDIVSLIQMKTSIPIYSKIQPYIYAGAIGGVVDWGQHHGKVAGEFIVRLINGNTISDLPLIKNSLDITVFNYDSLLHYNVNPLKLPPNSLILNKGVFDLLLPLPLRILVWILLIFLILLLISIMIFHIKRKKDERLKSILFNKALEQEKFKNDFITTMSHEFRTPINIILSTVQLLNVKINNNVLDKKYINQKLNYISLNSNRLLKIINNIIDITKLESGYMKANFLYGNIVEIVEDTVLSTVDYAEARGINITFDTEFEEINTAFDKNKLERCILNLISNSIKFTPKNGNILIYMTLTDSKDGIIIEVSDSGVGIPQSELIHIFDRFHQVDTSLTRTSEGSGLGLFIVNELIKLQQGTITVESRVNLGSKFIITLPIKDTRNITTGNNSMDDDLNRLVKLEFSDLQAND